MNGIFRRLRPAASLALALCVVETLPASALPGQSTSQFFAWLKKPDLSVNLEKGRDEGSGWVTYHVLNGDHGVTWDFTALMDGSGRVREEILKLPTGADPAMTPIYHDGTGYGFTMLQALLGKDAAADFKAATATGPVPKAGDTTSPRFYRGKRFGWQSDAGADRIHLLTFAWLATRIKTSAACAKRPGGCDV